MKWVSPAKNVSIIKAQQRCNSFTLGTLPCNPTLLLIEKWTYTRGSSYVHMPKLLCCLVWYVYFNRLLESSWWVCSLFWKKVLLSSHYITGKKIRAQISPSVVFLKAERSEIRLEFSHLEAATHFFSAVRHILQRKKNATFLFIGFILLHASEKYSSDKNRLFYVF